MSAGTMHEAAPATQAAPVPVARAGGRWWPGVGVASLLALPLGWLLGHGALLPFYLGLYYFALFGLILGATAYRVGLPDRPRSRASVVAGSAVIVLITWCVAMTREASAFPAQMAHEAGERAKVADLAGRDIATYRADVRASIANYLTNEFPPGGTIGYVRWAAARSVLPADRIDGLRRDIRSVQSRGGFVARALLSIVTLSLGVGSMTMLLTRVPKPPSSPDPAPPAPGA